VKDEGLHDATTALVNADVDLPVLKLKEVLIDKKVKHLDLFHFYLIKKNFFLVLGIIN